MRKIVVFVSLLGLAGCGTLNFLSPSPPVYVVFFPDHATTLTGAAADIVRKAASEAKMKNADMVQITGPSTKIAPGYDPSLAEPRMQAVEATLVSDGVSKDRLVRASLTTTDVNVKADASGAQRVEIRVVDRPAN
jgi:hypothetical protein